MIGDRAGARAGLALAILAGVAAASYGVDAGAAWPPRGRGAREAAPAAAVVSIDRFLPLYDVSDRNETRVRAPVAITYQAARSLDLQRSAAVRAVLQSRKLFMHGQDGDIERRPFLEQVHAMGWSLLEEVPGRAMVFGAVTRPWEPKVRFHPLSPAQFAAFRKPGWAKIVWTLEVDPAPQGQSVFRTRTRVATTDATARRRFRGYWSKFSPGIMLVRHQALGLVKSDAERRARAAARR